MKNNLKSALTLLVMIALLVGILSTFSLTAVAQQSGENVKKGSFIYAPHTYIDGDLTDIYYYTDDVFCDSAFEYNEHLATMSMILASASISSQEPYIDYKDKSQNLNYLLNEWDFTDFKVNEYYTQRPKEQTMGVGIAHKTIGEGDDAYTLLAIVPRSAGYQKEWAGNFTVGKDGLHKGFATGRDIILDFACQYVEQNKTNFKARVKVWTVGYSRGAGVANLFAAYLDDNSQALGVTINKEDIFAYTYGTPSNVQYENETQKANLENNYKNIHNRFSDYDIVTYAPFKTWNFTYYGTTRLFDVYNKDKKAEMLKFLEKTNKMIYDLYTAEGSSADPDNFMPLMLQIGEDFSINFVPANPEYNIPSNQRDFLDERINFLTDNLVTDRQTYVDEGYEYALQQLTSFYFGLDANQSSMFFGGATKSVYMLAASYYCYYVSDFYLNEDKVMQAASVISQSLAMLEQYINGISEDDAVNTSSWYLYASSFLTGQEYAQLMTVLQSIVSNEVEPGGYIDTIRTTIKNFAVNITIKLFYDGVSSVQMDQEEKQQYLAELTSLKVAEPITDFLVYLLLGTDDETLAPFNPSNKNISYVITFAANAGRYMRVHNNEIILSWLRTEDSFYDNEDWHIHQYITEYDQNEHREKCSCGHIKNAQSHVFGEWDESEDGQYVRACSCGYMQTKIVSATPQNQQPTSPTQTVIKTQSESEVETEIVDYDEPETEVEADIDTEVDTGTQTQVPTQNNEENSQNKLGVIIFICIACALALSAVITLFFIKKRKV